MKTKTFLLFSTSVFATSIFLIVFHTQQPQSIQNIVTQTHQQIKDFQENLRDVKENHLVQDEQYFHQLGLGGHLDPWHNTTLPVLLTYSYGDNHASAVSFVRAALAKLPYTVLLYNMGLSPHSLAMVSNYCNSSRCVIMEFDQNIYPSHITDQTIHAFRPIIIQHALARVGGVIFMESAYRWVGEAGELHALWRRAQDGPTGGGVVAWLRRAAVTSLTHPRMFHYFHANLDDFLFVQMVDLSRLIVAAKPQVEEVMKAWIQCALTLDCIMPIGAQSGGCRFDKKPQYRYSGCHGHDASALSIVLGLRYGFEEAQYTGGPGGGAWTRVSASRAAAEFASLQRNYTRDDGTDIAAAGAADTHTMEGT